KKVQVNPNRESCPDGASSAFGRLRGGDQLKIIGEGPPNHATQAIAPLHVGIAERGDIEQRGYLYAEENSRLHVSRFKGLVGVRWTLSIGDCLPFGPCL